VHWEEIIREWVKPWVTPRGEGQSNWWGRVREGSERKREEREEEAGTKRGREGPARKTMLRAPCLSGGRKIILN